MNSIKTRSKEITEKFLTTKSKKETGKALGISAYGVDTALYHQGLDQYVAPSILAILKVRCKRAVEVAQAPPASVVSPQRRPPLVGTQPAERGIELTNAREWVYKYWEVNPDATPTQCQRALKDGTGEIVSRSTIGSWLLRWKRRNLSGESISPMPRVLGSELTWEDILQAMPDRIELALLVLDGITNVIADERQRSSELLKELDTASETIAKLSGQVKDITEDRKRLMQQYNELIIKTRSGGHFTLDQTKHILIPTQH